MSLERLWWIAIAVASVAAAPPPEDFDQDGIADIDDDCPTDPGTKEGKGCPGAAPPPPPPPPVTQPPPPPEPVRIEDDRIRIDERIRFAPGRATLVPQSRPLVARIAKAIEGIPKDRIISVVGHTDNQGSRQRNLALSVRRAKAVVAALVRAGIKRSRLKASGKGPDVPIADNGTRAGRAKNRRVEFLLEKP